MKHGSHSPVSAVKAKEIIRHGEVRGKPLTEKQKGLFGLIAGGGHPTRMDQARALKRKSKK